MSAEKIPTDINTLSSRGINIKARPRKTRLDEVKPYILFLYNIIYIYPSILVHNFYFSVFEK